MQSIKGMSTSLESKIHMSDAAMDAQITGRVDLATCVAIGELLGSIVRKKHRSIDAKASSPCTPTQRLFGPNLPHSCGRQLGGNFSSC